jgi:hypothetical protein
MTPQVKTAAPKANESRLGAAVMPQVEVAQMGPSPMQKEMAASMMEEA